jgi:hypothetical protein
VDRGGTGERKGDRGKREGENDADVSVERYCATAAFLCENVQFYNVRRERTNGEKRRWQKRDKNAEKQTQYNRIRAQDVDDIGRPRRHRGKKERR